MIDCITLWVCYVILYDDMEAVIVIFLHRFFFFTLWTVVRSELWSVLILIAVIVFHNIIVLSRLSFLFIYFFVKVWISRPKCLGKAVKWWHFNCILTMTIAVLLCNVRNALFPQVIYLKWTAKVTPEYFLSSIIPLAFFNEL